MYCKSTSKPSIYNSHLESAVNFKRCPAVSIRTVSYSKAGDILLCIGSSLYSDFSYSPEPSEINLDPLPSIIPFSRPSSLKATLWLQVKSGQVSGVVFVNFTRGFHVFIRDFAPRNSKGF